MSFLSIAILAVITPVQPAPAPAPVVHSVPAPAPVYRAATYRAPPVARPPQVNAPAYAPRALSGSAPDHVSRRAVIPNPRNWDWWAWNRDTIWHPASSYWGGGFWGRWSMLNPPPQFTSYSVAPGSPGAQLLGDYGLAQTKCGVGNLVVIHGPDNSMICAYPNGLVGAGKYVLDPATLTLQLHY